MIVNDEPETVARWFAQELQNQAAANSSLPALFFLMVPRDPTSSPPREQDPQPSCLAIMATPEQKSLLGARRREAVRLRTLPLENGSGESIHPSAGVPDAMGRPPDEGPFRSMAPPSLGRAAGTALRSAARTSEPHTPAPAQGHDPHRLPRGERCSTTRALARYYHSPVARARAGGRADYSLDNSFLRS